MTNPVPRSKGAMLFMAAPIIFGALLFGAVGLLVFLVWMGSTADGERVQMQFSGECMEKARPIIEKRMETIGLGEVIVSQSETSLSVTATLPDIENAKNSIPQLMAQRGILGVRTDTEWLFQELEVLSASIEQDESGMPYTKVVLEETARKRLEVEVQKHSSGFLYFYLDGNEIVKRPNHNLIRSDELRLRSIVGGKREQMRVTVDWSILLEHGPIPCNVALKKIVSM